MRCPASAATSRWWWASLTVASGVWMSWSPGAWQRGGGHLASFLQWVVFKVVPEAQARYGTVPGPLGAVLGGSSLGGLAALWGHFHHADTFGGALCISPSLWVANRAIFQDGACLSPAGRIAHLLGLRGPRSRRAHATRGGTDGRGVQGQALRG